jgi:hypothetical protein
MPPEKHALTHADADWLNADITTLVTAERNTPPSYLNPTIACRRHPVHTLLFIAVNIYLLKCQQRVSTAALQCDLQQE